MPAETHRSYSKVWHINVFFKPVITDLSALWGHNIDISPFKFIWRHTQQLSRNMIIHLESCLCPTDEYKSNIYSLLALFLVSTNS